MRILALADLHSRSVKPLLEFKGIDLVLVLGDITTGASLAETKERINPLRDSYPALYAIGGNWDRPESTQWLADEEISMDGRVVRFADIVLFGVGGSTPTPFNTPNEFPEEEFGKKLADCPEPQEGERLLLCSHNPPYGGCDKVLSGQYVGSKNLRGFIEERKPHLVLCGHIHEGRGKAMIGETVVVNPGTAPRHYALIEIAESISIDLH
jgi:Icc-related predicted phosphoesterase